MKETKGSTTKEYTYIGGDAYTAPVVAVKKGSTTSYYYLLRDYLGNITHQVNTSNSVVAEYSYDAWGRRRVADDWDDYNISSEPGLLAGRGFTGHEHLTYFNLVNMNGRLYDPVVGRFLSADPYIQSPGFTQNFNRYSYCLNNPLLYTDPSGEFFWVIPNIGWSKNGGLSAGISLVFGIPGGASAQVGVGYNFKSNDVYAYAGATLAMNTVYSSYSMNDGGSVGYVAGLSPFSGLPISTNFGTVGVNYNITHNSWSSNFSAWQVDQNGWAFNPGVSAMVFSEQATNFVRGQGFASNDVVLSRFVEAGNQHGALDYFGFEGTYTGTTKGPNYVDGGNEGTPFLGSTDPKTGAIQYGDLAFDSYDKLKMTYTKEMYHSLRVMNGIPLETQETILGKHTKYFPEERLGFIHAYKNQGLYPSHGTNIVSNIGYYQFQSINLGPSQYYIPKWWHFIYKIPRRW